MLTELGLGDILRLRKPHPCGGYEWRVVRLGADIGLECLTCGRRVMLERRALKNRLKKILLSADSAQDQAQPGDPGKEL
ncbi:MAG TPA: DUF951 domain-containing protein [Brevefilum sp.]|nr:DUF951 domain-containing protein [Brevefilum sp.]HOR19018.1 DUF951 domain-containing protein [Brevefilum sp.]HPL69303.1 DUF951 domain-containing protein [Brevefilum sp.]